VPCQTSALSVCIFYGFPIGEYTSFYGKAIGEFEYCMLAPTVIVGVSIAPSRKGGVPSKPYLMCPSRRSLLFSMHEYSINSQSGRSVNLRLFENGFV
jgi:hypothetical protein